MCEGNNPKCKKKKNLGAKIFIIVLFIKEKYWKRAKCSIMEEWLTLQFGCIMRYFTPMTNDMSKNIQIVVYDYKYAQTNTESETHKNTKKQLSLSCVINSG